MAEISAQSSVSLLQSLSVHLDTRSLVGLTTLVAAFLNSSKYGSYAWYWCTVAGFRELVADGAFLSKYAHLFMPTYLCRKAPKKQHFVEEGLTNEGRHNLLLLYKQADDKRGIADSLHAYTTRARPTEFEVGVFSTES